MPANAAALAHADTEVPASRYAAADDAGVLAEIYSHDTNIAVWQRTPGPALQAGVEHLIAHKPWFKAALTLSPATARAAIDDATQGDLPPQLAEDIAELVDMFCYLFDLERAGLRLAVLGGAMCPRFHVDHVPVRLITTYHGVATEWLPHGAADRSKLGRGSNGLPDSESGLYARDTDIRQVRCGDVALIKGSAWVGNEATGLVHRSPAVPAGQNRLLLTLDVSD